MRYSMKQRYEDITLDNGEKANAQAPIIISASRSTDIPAFYSKWLIDRLEKGYVKWKNPFNGKPLYVTFNKARAIVFWSKNPKPLIKHLDFISKKIPNYYFQFTLNDYEKENLERNLPSLDSRIDTFKQLSNQIGKEKVIWRFDPLILTNEISIDILVERIGKIADQLGEYTEKLVFSYADISIYKKVQNNLKKEAISYQEFTVNKMEEFAEKLQELNKIYKFEIGTCCEKIDLDKYNISHNKCIDDDLMIKLFRSDKILMDFLGVEITPSLFEDEVIKTKKLKDKGQRAVCGCIMSKDIGQYNTCPHECVYCYANTSIDTAWKNYRKYQQNQKQESILGD